MTGQPTARDVMLDRVVVHMIDDGVPTGSMRAFARDLGVSYQLLNYHFGDRHGVLRAALLHIQSEVESDLHAFLSRAPQNRDPQHLWRHLTAPGANRLRLQGQILGLALLQPDEFGDLGAEITQAWLRAARELWPDDTVTAATRGRRATLIVAALRGLAVDLATTADERRVNAAVRELQDVFAAWR